MGSNHSQIIYGLNTVQSLLTNNPEKIRVLFVQIGKDDARTHNIVNIAKKNQISVQYISKNKLDILLKQCVHQGVAANVVSTSGYDENYLAEILSNVNGRSVLFLALDCVKDPHNLGACLRSANAAGVDAVIVPKNNSASLTSAACKVASGAAETIPFIQVTNLARTLRFLKEQNIWVYGADSGAKTTIYDNNWRCSVVIVMGGEENGLRRLTRECCDDLVKIPMFGDVSSLNVSVATGICLFEVIRQRFWSVKS